MAAEDPDSPLDLFEGEEYRDKLINTLIVEWVNLEQLDDDKLAKLCKKRNLREAKNSKKQFMRQLKVLLKRIHRTTDEATGGQEFRKDIDQLQLDAQQVLTAGIAKVDDLTFCRHKPGQNQLHF